LWREVTEAFDLRTDELRALRDAARAVDLIERMEAELAAGDLFVKGHVGQPVANPLAGEVRQQKALVVRLLSALHLPDTEDSVVRQTAERSAHGRALAQQRWRRGA
jgi:hypothetical protein